MPRNEAKPLSEFDHRLQMRAVRHLQSAQTVGRPVRLAYTKRDGNFGIVAGPVQFFSGKPGFDTGSVTIEDTAKGPRTINLHRIHTITTE